MQLRKFRPVDPRIAPASVCSCDAQKARAGLPQQPFARRIVQDKELVTVLGQSD
jgi:hypothetical protein